MIDIKDFFKNIAVPSFLIGEFTKEDWYLISTRLKGILKAEIKKTETKSSNATLITRGIVYIGENCLLGDYIVIEGPAYIGENVEIVSHSYIRPGSVICNGCSVGHAAEVKAAIMMEGSKIANHAFLGDSILGKTARLGGHTETQNRKFEQDIIHLSYKDQRISTGCEKYGAIIGEGSRLGGGVLTFPGTSIGKNTFIMSGLSIGGYIPPDTFVKSTPAFEFRKNRFTSELKNNFSIIEKDENY